MNTARPTGRVFYLASQTQAYTPKILFFLAMHIPLALMMRRIPIVADVHAAATLIVGIIFAASDRPLEKIAYFAAYMVGCEVLWRMCHGQPVWEYGKYATALVLIVGMIRHGKLKGPLLPTLYFLCLLPSAFMTVDEEDWEFARQALSFNLSGPFALLIAAWFFSNVKLTVQQVLMLFLILLGPIVGILTLALTGTIMAEEIHFSSRSVRITAGGFGPNQVSSILGLGVLVCFFLVLDPSAKGIYKLIFLGLMMTLGIQSALTFSRSGLYMAFLAAGAAGVFLFREARSRVNLLVLAAGIFVVTVFIVIPRLTSFTRGTISDRFGDTSLTGRDKIAEVDFQIWMDNPIFGVGPGRAPAFRALLYRDVAAHTEFTRLLAEHGVFGLASILFLLLMAWQNMNRPKSHIHKAMIAALLGWSILFLAVNAMRVVAPSFMFGLTFATLISERKIRQDVQNRNFVVMTR
jgi:O-Antigen ligase